MYGTAKSQILKIQEEGKIPLLDIDVQGALLFHKAFPKSNFFAILPPSTESLKERLVLRGTETPTKIETRIANADGEFRTIMANKHIFNYRIINEELETSQKTVINLIDALYSKELTGK